MVAEYSVAIMAVPKGGRAVANINTTNGGQQSDVDSVTVVWKDHNNLTLATQTYSGIDQSGLDIYGNTVTLSNPAGTGNYKATLDIEDSAYTFGAAGERWSLTITIVNAGAPRIEGFGFTVVESALDISLDTVNIALSMKRQLGILADVSAFGERAQTSGTILDLGKEIVYGIAAAYKNGADFLAGTTGDTYRWVTYRPYVLLNTAAASTDHYLFRIQYRFSDEVIADYIAEAEAVVMSHLRNCYDEPTINGSPTTAMLIGDRALGRMRIDSTEGTANDSARFRSGRDLMNDTMKHIAAIQRGEASLRDSAGERFGRRSGSLAGGFRSEFAFDTRLGLVDRLQQYTGFFVEFPPGLPYPVSPRIFPAG